MEFTYYIMENSNQAITSHTSQEYNLQVQPAMWSTNKMCSTNCNQNANTDPYSQQMNHFYQASYSTTNSNEINRYISPASKSQNSNSVAYSMTGQNNFSCANSLPNHSMAVKNSCSNMFYGNVNASKPYSTNSMVQLKKYASSSLGLSDASQAVPQSTQVTQNIGRPRLHMTNYGDQNTYIQNMYVNNCDLQSNGENQSFLMRQTTSSSSMLLSQQEASMVQATQVSSIPTPPETSSLPGDGTSPDTSAEIAKMNTASAAFVLPGSSIGHIPSSMPCNVPSSSVAANSSLLNRNIGVANLDEGSQASSASASSSLPDEQNSAKTSSKPNFSYPPTPNTLSSPGAASMSSFHDDLECISSPSWPKTPASPVANSNYEFANIKRPENLLKLYTLSDEPDRRYFLDKLIVFNEERGSPITQCPTISKQPLDVFRVYLTVKERGGFLEVTNAKRWKDIAGAIGVGASSSAAYTLRKQYMKLLLPFECKFDRGGIDPQPIINIVEASSRKKGKNTTGAYGNSRPYNQGYSQVIDRYHPNYSSYQTSRYPCNSVEYQCSTNSINYQQPVTHSTHPNAVTDPNQYNQYSQNSSSNCGYFQGSSTTSPFYNNNLQNSTSNNTCRYGSISNAVPHQQGQSYYAQPYSSLQSGQFMQENCCTSGQDNFLQPVSNQVHNDVDYSKVSSGTAIVPSESNLTLRKAACDTLLSCVSLSSLNYESSQDSKSFSSNYNTLALNQSSINNVTCISIPDTSQTYPNSTSENRINQKMSELNFYPSSQVSHSTINSYSNEIQNSYSNQKTHFQDYHSKEQLQSSQFGQYSEAQNESYRGSEGPPSAQVDQRSLPSGDIPANNAKVYPYNSTTQKVAGYNFGVQGEGNKNVSSATTYNSHFSSGPQRTWPADHYSYQPHVSNQRISFKNHFNSPTLKQNSDSSPIQKLWLNSQDNEPIPNKPHSLLSTSAQNQILPATKPQPSLSNITVSMMKRPLEFPANSVESVKAIAAKRRRCPAKRLGNIDPWRLMLALKSGLLAECTWALDTLAILLADNSTVVYFGLNHLPGLLNVLVDHYRCFLNKIFHLANDVEIETFKKIKNQNDFSYLTLNEISDIENKIKVLDTPNYTYKTRCKKKIEIQYDEAIFLIDPQRSWDKYEGFDVSLDHWQKGGGDITSHIHSTFDSCSKKNKFSRELYNEEKTKHKINKVSVRVKSLKPILSKPPILVKSSMLHKGEPVVVLQKFNFLANKISASDDESYDSSLVNSNTSPKRTIKYVNKEEDSMDSCEISKDVSSLLDDINELKSQNIETEFSRDSQSNSEISLQLRASLSSRKRFLCENLENESYCFDEPALSIISDSQEMLSRRCVSVSTILRNLSFVPGNDLIMSKNSGVLLLLGRLLLLHHEHKPTKNAYDKYAKEIAGNECCISLKDDPEWWWGTLSVLRANSLVILSNISGALDLAPFPEEVSLPILDGLLHWIVCPSSYAQDPLPSSVLSPQRLSLEALCKLSVLSSNVDLILATPPWSRIENLFSFLTKSLCQGQDQIMREFALILLSNISHADYASARTIAEQSHSISYLIAFIEEAEANAFQIAISQGTKKLRDKPELMGTTPGMVKRAASTLKNLALVPENQDLFGRHQARLLSLVMSQVMDQELAAVIADVLFYCSEHGTDDPIPIS